MRTDYDISNEDFEKDTNPFYRLVDDYIRKTVLYPYLAFYIANKYKMNAMWEGSLPSQIQSAVDSLCNIDLYKINIKKINKELKNYGLKIINDKPLKIKKS